MNRWFFEKKNTWVLSDKPVVWVRATHSPGLTERLGETKLTGVGLMAVLDARLTREMASLAVSEWDASDRGGDHSGGVWCEPGRWLKWPKPCCRYAKCGLRLMRGVHELGWLCWWCATAAISAAELMSNCRHEASSADGRWAKWVRFIGVSGGDSPLVFELLLAGGVGLCTWLCTWRDAISNN